MFNKLTVYFLCFNVQGKKKEHEPNFTGAYLLNFKGLAKRPPTTLDTKKAHGENEGFNP